MGLLGRTDLSLLRVRFLVWTNWLERPFIALLSGLLRSLVITVSPLSKTLNRVRPLLTVVSAVSGQEIGDGRLVAVAVSPKIAPRAPCSGTERRSNWLKRVGRVKLSRLRPVLCEKF